MRALVALVALVALLLLVACETRGPTLSVAQAAELSQARADVDASRSPVVTPEESLALTRAAAAHLMAATANLDLPAPTTPVVILTAPDPVARAAAITAEASAADQAERDPPAGVLGLVAGLTAAAVSILGVLRFLPGVYGPLAGTLAALLAPPQVKAARERERAAVPVAERAVAYGAALAQVAHAAGLGDRVRAVNAEHAAIQDALGLRDQIRALLAEVPPPSPPTGVPLSR